jgi:hypothetical protein
MSVWPKYPGYCDNRHKTLVDHSRLDGETRLWTCSVCRAEAPWSESWGYWGNIECTNCWATRMDEVWCSEACRQVVLSSKPVEQKRRKPGRPRKEAKAL